MGMFLVSFVILVALVTVLSGIGVGEHCGVGSGGVYSMISSVLGGQTGGTIGLLYVFGQVSLGCGVGNCLEAAGMCGTSSHPHSRMAWGEATGVGQLPLFFKSSREDMFIDFRERGRRGGREGGKGRERERERDQLPPV